MYHNGSCQMKHVVEFAFYCFALWPGQHDTASTYRLYIQPPHINIQTVYTVTTHQHTDCIYSHHTSTYRLYIQPPHINIQTVYTVTTHQHTDCIYRHHTSTYRLYIQPPHINIQTVYTVTTHQHTDCIYRHHTGWRHDNCSNITILTHFIVNRTILMFKDFIILRFQQL